MDTNVLNISNVVGVWSLESFIIVDENKNTKNWGNNVHGLLIYAKSGHMSVSMNRDMVSTGNEFKDIYDAGLLYSGKFKIDGNIIVHKVTEASNPLRIGKDQTRYAKLDKDKLVLSSPKESFGTAHLTWKRLNE